MHSFSLTADMMYVASNAPRIARALFEIAARRRWNSAADLLLTVCKVGGKGRAQLRWLLLLLPASVWHPTPE